MKWLYKLSILVFSLFLISGPLHADMGPRRVLLLGGSSSILPPPFVPNQPDVFFDFTKNLALQKTSGASTATSLLTTSRASTGYISDSSGNWSLVAANTPRISNLGLLIEEARTNNIRNNSMQGAIVGANNVELTTNGNFAAQGTGWTVGTAGAGSVVFSTGSVTITGDGATNGNYVSQLVSGLVVGRSYVVTIASSAFPNMVGLVGTTPGSSNIASAPTIAGNGNNSVNPDRFAFTATQATAWVSIAHQGANGGILSSVSVQDGERAQNGTFVSNPINASINTVQNGWSWTNNAGTGSATYNSGAKTVTILGDGTNGISLNSAAIPTIVGQTYIITVDVTSSGANVQAGTGAGGANLLSVSSGTTTGQKFQFTATTTTSFISFAKVSAVGAVIANVSVQSAGTIPTNWAVAAPAGVIRSVANLGTDNGIDFIDIQWQLTGAVTDTIQFDSGSQIAALYGQTWASSFFSSIVGGSTTNISTFQNLISENTSGGSFLAASTANITPGSGTGVLGQNRNTLSRTLVTPTAGAVINAFRINSSGSANVTVRLGWPQIENNSSLSSIVSSATVAAGGTGGTTGTAVYSVGGGAGTTGATLNVTVSGGAITTINSVNNPGAYTTFPPSPAALTYVSGTGSGVTGATVNLVPASNGGALGIATSPIRTTGSSATRAADFYTLTIPGTFGAAYSMYSKVLPEVLAGNTGFYAIAPGGMVNVGDGTNNNRAATRLGGSSGAMIVVNAGTTVVNIANGSTTLGASNKIAGSFAAGAQALSTNGNGVTTAAAATIPAVSVVTFGESANNGQWLNGYLQAAAIWRNQAVPNTLLQAITQ